LDEAGFPILYKILSFLSKIVNGYMLGTFLQLQLLPQYVFGIFQNPWDGGGFVNHRQLK
jgi:hypothetical protein